MKELVYKRRAAPKSGEGYGHFTQVIWAKTTHVGCAAMHIFIQQQKQNGHFGLFLFTIKLLKYSFETKSYTSSNIGYGLLFR